MAEIIEHSSYMDMSILMVNFAKTSGTHIKGSLCGHSRQINKYGHFVTQFNTGFLDMLNIHIKLGMTP